MPPSASHRSDNHHSGDDDISAEGGEAKHSLHLDVVRFQAEGWDAAIQASQIQAMRPGSDMGAVAIETLLGLRASPRPRTRVLMIRTADGKPRAVKVSEPVQLLSLPATAIFPVPELVRHRCGLKGLKALAFTEFGMLLLIDLGL